MTTGLVDPRALREDTLVCCAVGDTQYALRGSEVRQIVRVEQMRAAPGRGGRVGTLDEGGDRAIPVFRLADILGHGAPRGTQGAGHHIAVTGERGQAVGWLVDRVARTPVSEDAQVVSLPALVGGTAALWFDALVRLGDHSMLLLAPESLNPLARRKAPAATAAAAPARQAAAEPGERIVLLFSTPALPVCPAARFAISGRRIAAITQPEPPIPVPGSARHVAGLVWWRHAVVPVIDFRGPGEHDDPASRRRHIVAQCGARLGSSLVALPVDPESAMHRPGPEDHRAAGVPAPPFVSGVFEVGGETVALLDLDALLVEESVHAAAGTAAHPAADDRLSQQSIR
jgi:chemotaxis signal transduction protein